MLGFSSLDQVFAHIEMSDGNQRFGPLPSSQTGQVGYAVFRDHVERRIAHTGDDMGIEFINLWDDVLAVTGNPGLAYLFFHERVQFFNDIEFINVIGKGFDFFHRKGISKTQLQIRHFIQSKLLHVLETKQVMRLGSDYVIPLDIRIISASNADIIAAVQAGTFRRDLFFRINTLRLVLPPLNERPDDILYLFAHFLESFTHRRQPLKRSLKKALIQHDWWGNIRELHSVALRYYIFGDTLDDDYDALFDIPDENRKEALLDTASLQLNMKSLEKTIHRILIEELQEKGYSQKDIAKLLNVSRQTIFNKMH